MGKWKSALNRMVYSRVAQILVDAIVFVVAFLAPFVIRFAGIPSQPEVQQMMMLLPFVVLARCLSFGLMSVYQTIWRFVSLSDAVRILMALVPTSLVLLIGRLEL